MQKRSLLSEKIVYMFFFLFPIMPLYFEIAGISAISLLSLFLVFAISAFRGLEKRRYTRVSFLKAVLLIWIICRCIAIVRVREIKGIVLFLIGTAGIYWAIKKVVTDREMFLKCIRMIVYSGAFVSMFGIVEEVTRFNIFSLLTNESLNYNPLRFGILRILSFSSHTIIYGVYLMFVMSLCVYYMQFLKNKIRMKRVFICIYGLLWLNMLLTLSRSIIMVAVVSQLLLLYLCGMRKLAGYVLAAAVLGVLVFAVVLIAMPSVIDKISEFIYMFLAIFDKNLAAEISSSFGNDNLNAVGNRIDLYGWVFSAMDNHWVWGHGHGANFDYAYTMTNGVSTWIQHKRGIEVHYLETLYRYGSVGLVAEISALLAFFFTAVKKGGKPVAWEPVMGFAQVAAVVMFCYMLQIFAVSQSSDKDILYLFVILFLIYIEKRKDFEREEVA